MSIVKVRAALEKQLLSLTNIVPGASIISVTVGPAAVFTTDIPLNLPPNTPVTFRDHLGSVPPLDGVYLVVPTGPNTFSLRNTATQATVSVTGAGSGGLVQASLTSFQNAMFKPVVGLPYQEVHLIPFKPDEPTQGAGYFREHGLFQVTLVYPLGVGTGALLARAEMVRSGFRRGSSFTESGVTVQIHETPEFGRLDGTEDSVRMPVKVYYSANIYN